MTFKSFHPPHIYLDDTIYFVTSRTKDRQQYFNTDKKKSLLKNILKLMADRYGIALFAWVILNNHYHLLARTKDRGEIFRFIKALHGKSAIELNKLKKITR